MDKVALEANSKAVLIFGNFSLESVEDKIIAIGHTFVKSTRFSQALRWLQIEKDLKLFNIPEELLAVLIFLNRDGLLQFSTQEDFRNWHELLSAMKQSTSLLFIEQESFRDNILFGTFEQIKDIFMQYISDNLNLFNKVISNNDYKFKSKIISLEIEIMDDYVSINYEFEKKSGSLMQRYDINYIDKDFFIKLKKLLDIIDLARLFILTSSDDQGYAIHATMQIKLIEALFEQFQRDIVEKQTELSQKVKHLLKLLQESGVEIVPYKTRKEISVRVHHFLDEIDKGIFFHLYVPNGRYQQDQLASFLRLFESYMQRVEKLQFFIDTRKTLHGQIYEFKSQNSEMNLIDIEVALSRFEQFMSLCQNDQKKAEALLLKKGMDASNASRLLTKYLKDYQSLVLDIEYERERKLLDLRYRFESEALKLSNGTALSVTQSIQPSTLLSLPDPLNITISNSSVIINPGLQSYIEQAFYGDVQYTSEDKQLIELFQIYAKGLESSSLQSQLDQLKDPSSSEIERKTAMQKISSFLLTKVAPAIGQSALTVLTAYLEKKLTGS